MKKEKTTSIAEKFGYKTNAIFPPFLRFANTQSRRISAVTHIKILSAEHAQAKCPSANSRKIKEMTTGELFVPLFTLFTLSLLSKIVCSLCLRSEEKNIFFDVHTG